MVVFVCGIMNVDPCVSSAGLGLYGIRRGECLLSKGCFHVRDLAYDFPEFIEIRGPVFQEARGFQRHGPINRPNAATSDVVDCVGDAVQTRGRLPVGREVFLMNGARKDRGVGLARPFIPRPREMAHSRNADRTR